MAIKDHSADSSPLSDAIAELIAAHVEHPEATHAEALQSVLAAFPGREDEVRARLGALRALGIEFEHAASSGIPERLGDFRLIRSLGEGGMGVVYLAEQVSLGREVALKLIRPELVFFPRARERFAREVEAVARLQHPGIVPVHTVGEAEGIPFFAMERFRGCTLGELLEQLEGRAPESISGEEVGALIVESAGARELEAFGPAFYSGTWVGVVLRIIEQVAEALQHAHGRGIVHRDVKPSNIALTVDGRAMLLDFGLTRSPTDESLTRTGATLGTLHYMAPEQVRGGDAGADIGPHTDIYALGVTLYQALTLQLPYVGADRAEIERRILAGEPDPPRARNREIPPDAATVCLHALEADPARRYATAADFARDLGHVRARHPIEARPPSLLVRGQRLVERNRARALALLLGLGLVTILPSALLLQQALHNRTLRASRDALAETLERRDQALARALQSESVQEQMFSFLNGLFGAIDPDLALGAEPSVRAILDAGADRIEEAFPGQPEAQAMLRWSLGRVYTSLGDYARALDMLEPAADLFRESIESGASSRLSFEQGEDIRWLTSILHDLGIAHTKAHSLDRAEVVLREGLERSRALSDPSLEARLLSSLGVVSADLEDWEQAASLFDQALVVYAADDGADPVLVSTTRINLAWVLPRLGLPEQADEAFGEALAQLRSALDPMHPSLAKGLNLYSLFLKQMGRLQESREALEEAVRILRVTLPADNETLGVVIYNLGRAHDDGGNVDEALELYGEAREVFSSQPPDNFNRLLNEANYANALLRLADVEGALAIYAEIVPHLERRWPAGHEFLRNIHQSWAVGLRELGMMDEARLHEEQSRP